MSTDAPLEREAAHSGHGPTSLPALTLSALGVVYGDIGTSPIYALRETLRAASGEGLPPEAEVIGVLSIIFWALTVVVSLKYALIVLRADNNGEGGTLSTMALALPTAQKIKPLVLSLGMIAAALFFGDAVITPAISVLSAVEGLEIASPSVEQFVVPITIVILVTLFSVQRFGTAKVSAIFGPVTLVWFIVLAIAGISHIIDAPQVVTALNPLEAAGFALRNPGIALAVLGAAFLAVTGAEALYVDLGHFGRRPIVVAWFAIVFPSLVMNYFGQAAFLIKEHAPPGHPLFEMMPEWALLPMVLLATAATVIASQAVISGAYSFTRQAVQLNLLPRFHILHTSETQAGQIYLPQLNWMLLASVLLLVIGFQTSDALSGAYGISVSGQMLVTTVLLAIVMRNVWNWKLSAVLAIAVPLGAIDLLFLSSNSLKLLEGGWVSVTIAAALFLLMLTWTKGSDILFHKTRRTEMPLGELLASLEKGNVHRVQGTAIFLTSDPDSAPTSLLHSLKHYKVLHEKNVILTVRTLPVPRVRPEDQITIQEFSGGFTRMHLQFGYMEDANVPRALAASRKLGFKFDIMSTSFFLSRRSLKPSRNSGMPYWQDQLYIGLSRNAADATSYFSLPTGRVVEIGTQVII